MADVMDTRPTDASVERQVEGRNAPVGTVWFTFSDLIGGYVTQFNRAERRFGIRTSDGREFKAYLTPAT